MAKTMTMTRNLNHYENASSKKVNTGDNGGVGPWSDLHHHVLFLVMMQVGVVDYFSFGGVCKLWRSLAISNRITFMASKPPMTMRISWRRNEKTCYLEDFEGRKFKTILPHFVDGAYVGLTCGYLIFFNKTTRAFWLVNPITRQQLYFRDFPINYTFPIKDRSSTRTIRAILVFSPSLLGWVFLVTRSSNQIWFWIAGKWNNILFTSIFHDLRAFKGKIYTLNRNLSSTLCEHLYELRFNPEPKLTLLETKNSLKPSQNSELVSSNENIYVIDRVHPNGSIYKIDRTPKDRYRFQELDLREMKWVLREKTMGECASFLSNLKHGVTDIRFSVESPRQGLLLGHNTGEMLKLIELEKASSFTANMWYFPHECFNVNVIYD